MKENDRPGQVLRWEIRAGIRTRVGLLLCFLIGMALAAAGLQGQRELTESGFGSEAAYQAIYALSGDAEEIGRILREDLSSLPEDAGREAERAAREVLAAGGLQDAGTL